MASVLGITVLEKDRKQELVSKVREYLEANPSVRNNVQFIQVTWRSNRKASTIVASTPETASSQSLLSPRFPSLSLRLHTGGQMASSSYLAPSVPSLYSHHAHHAPPMNYVMTPWSYQFPSQVNGLQVHYGYALPNHPLPQTIAPNHEELHP